MILRATMAVVCVLVPAAAWQVKSGQTAEEEAIRSAIHNHYVMGHCLSDDFELLREGLAPTFVFHRFWNNEFGNSDINDWFAKLKQNAGPRDTQIETRIEVLDVTGVAAVAKLELLENGRLKFTDYFGLYKTENGWKLVSKIFHYHP